jgi:hypothetical protein
MLKGHGIDLSDIHAPNSKVLKKKVYRKLDELYFHKHGRGHDRDQNQDKGVGWFDTEDLSNHHIRMGDQMTALKAQWKRIYIQFLPLYS